MALAIFVKAVPEWLSKFHKIQKIGADPWPIPVAFPIPLGGQCLYCPVWGLRLLHYSFVTRCPRSGTDRMASTR